MILFLSDSTKLFHEDTVKRRIGIGISDFKKVIEEGYFYVDKTLLIEELTALMVR